jgi:hypothetical protein
MSISNVANTALGSLWTATPSAKQGRGQGQFQQIQSEIQWVGQDLQAGNWTQAQQDYATIQQDSQQQQQGSGAVHHPQHHGGGGGGQHRSQISWALDSLSTALQQDLEQFTEGGGTGATTGTSFSSPPSRAAKVHAQTKSPGSIHIEPGLAFVCSKLV